MLNTDTVILLLEDDCTGIFGSYFATVDQAAAIQGAWALVDKRDFDAIDHFMDWVENYAGLRPLNVAGVMVLNASE